MTTQMRVIIVEDHEHQRLLLEERLNKLNFNVVGSFKNTKAARAFLETEEIDGAFLDMIIQAESELAGFDFANDLTELSNKPWFVTISGQKNYDAIMNSNRLFGFIQHLQKPITNSDLKLVIEKIHHYTNAKTTIEKNYLISIPYTISNNNGEYHKEIISLKPSEIIYISFDEHEKVKKHHTAYLKRIDGKQFFEITKKLELFLYELKEHGFMQIHKSHLVNTNYLKDLIKIVDPDKDKEEHFVTFTIDKCTDEKPVEKNKIREVTALIENRKITVN